MGSPSTLISLDFGSDYIRVAKTRFEHEVPSVLNPQLIEFNGRRSLRNIVLLNSDLTGIQEIGEEVINSDLLYDTPDLVRRGLSLLSDPDSELGRATDYLLDNIYHVLELDHLSDEERLTWRTFLAMPPCRAYDLTTQWEERLKRVGFPCLDTFDSTLAIVAYYYPTNPMPGRYLVVDCGAGNTRVALCEIEGQDVHILDIEIGRPGGRDFDQVLVEHFGQLITDSTLLSTGSRLEMVYFVEEFKKQFAHAWAIGQDSYEALYPIPSAQTVLNLRCADFESALLAGELVASFRNLTHRAVEENNIAPDQLAGVYLAGGGAYWPFIRTWANELVGSERVHVSEYPEEVIVRGLVHLAVVSAIMPQPSKSTNSSLVQPVIEPQTRPFSPAERPLHTLRTMSPTRAFWFEFIGGLFGLMGIGWFFVLHNVPLGCLGLLGWWAILIISIVGLGIFSAVVFNPLPLLGFIIIWLCGPLISAVMAYRVASRRPSRGGA